MFIVIPHVGKSHLTYRLIQSVPDGQHMILVDGSYVRDLSTIARVRSHAITYKQTEGVPHCLAHNWNLGASLVPKSEPYWMFCATDIEFSEASWARIATLERNYPDCGIIKDAPTNWNVWLVRRWAWDLLAPMDERYKPCGGEDDDLVMKCATAGIKIKEGLFVVQHADGGHATRLDVGDTYRGTTWGARHANIALFQKKWGCIPSKGKDAKYRKAITDTHMKERRTEPPKTFTIPTVRPAYPEKSFPTWPSPLKVNLGCGTKKREGFVNVDIANKGAAVLLDVAKDDWPWGDGTVDEVHSYHLIEHLTECDGKAVTAKTFRALRSGGRVVIECPDLEKICRDYPRSTRKGRWGMYGISRWGDPMRHRFGYCGPTLALLLSQAGFKDIKTGPGTDYHSKIGPCVRAEAVKP